MTRNPNNPMPSKSAGAAKEEVQSDITRRVNATTIKKVLELLDSIFSLVEESSSKKIKMKNIDGGEMNKLVMNLNYNSENQNFEHFFTKIHIIHKEDRRQLLVVIQTSEGIIKMNFETKFIEITFINVLKQAVKKRTTLLNKESFDSTVLSHQEKLSLKLRKNVISSLFSLQKELLSIKVNFVKMTKTG